jgi:arylsulfatase
VRQGRWKLVDWRDFEAKANSGWQLYDLAADPGETRDLAAAQPAVVADLRARWEVWDRGNAAPRWRGTPNEDPPATTAPSPR